MYNVTSNIVYKIANPSFGNVKAYNLIKLKLLLSPAVAAMAAGGPGCGWGATAGKFLRQTKGRTVFGKESFESGPFQPPLEVQ